MDKLFNGLEAAQLACRRASQWTTESGELWGRERLLDIFGAMEKEDPLDTGKPSVYYIVDEEGALGFTHDDCRNIGWMLRPTHPDSTGCCPGCQARLLQEWRFCPFCGERLL